MSDLLLDLDRSVREFHERFNVKPTPDGTARMVAEETRELLQAADRWDVLANDPNITLDSYDYANGFWHEIPKEAADVLYVVIGLLQAHGISMDELARSIKAVTVKNDSKNPDNCMIVAGKVVPKSKL